MPALFDELRGLLAEIGGTTKQADAAADPGGYAGASTHPSAQADGNLQAPREGARAAENEADVKKEIPASVNSTAGNTGTQAEVQLGQGVKADETGKNVPTVKGDKEDPGTSTPITTEDGQKYGSYAGKPFGELYKTAAALGNDLIALVAVQATKQAQAPTPAPATPAAPAPAAAAAVSAEAEKAAQAGYALAQQLAGQPTPEQIKAANARLAARQILSDGLLAADLYHDFMTAYEQKRAADESDSTSGDTPPKKEKKEESGESGGGDSGPAGGGDSGPAGGGDSGPAGGDAMGAMGGLGGGGGGGSPDPAAVEQLLMALLEMGVTPEMLLGGVQHLDGGAPMPGGAGGPPGAGGGDPLAAMAGGGGPPAPGGAGGPPGMEVAAAHRKAAADTKARLVKLAAAAKSRHAQLLAAGSFRFQPAKTAQEETARRQIQGFVRELLANR